MGDNCLEILNRLRAKDFIEIYTFSGKKVVKVLRNAYCRNNKIVISSFLPEDGIPCYHKIVRCEINRFIYETLANYDIKLQPNFMVKGTIDEGIIVERLDDNIEFEIRDEMLMRILLYVNKNPNTPLYRLAEEFMVVYAFENPKEYSEDEIEWWLIRLGIAVGFLAYEAKLIFIS